MELLKLDERSLEYKWQDVTFKVKPRISSGDKWNIVTRSRIVGKDQVEFGQWDFYLSMIKTFVVGWEGVTDGGKPVPYSFEAFMARLPSTPEDNLVMQLGYFVAKELGFVQGEAEAEKSKDIKNG